MKTKEQLIELMITHLQQKRVTLWQTWDLTDAGRLEEAAVWFVNTLEEVGFVEIEQESREI